MNALVAMLTTHDIPYWVDREIEAGTAWREEIDDALESAFAVAVIITPQSMGSAYVNYEWSWALGHGIPVIPLVFENMSEALIHPRLNALQLIKCYPDLPQTIVEAASKYQQGSCLTSHIEKRISDTMLPLRFLARTLLWFQPYCLFGENFQTFWILLIAVIVEIRTLKSEKFPDIWLHYSQAFTTRQRRDFQQLSDALNKIAPVFVDMQARLPEQTYFETVVNHWQQDFEGALKHFDGYDNNFYRAFDMFLSAYSASPSRLTDRQTQQVINIFEVGVLTQAPIPDQVKQLIRQAVEKATKVSIEGLTSSQCPADKRNDEHQS